MANGGWYGTPEEWERLEAPLIAVDPILERFATRHGLSLTKNGKGAPERSVRWGDSLSFLIQIYLDTEVGPSWNLWLCCSQDRDGERYWRRDFAVQNEPIEAFSERLPAILEECFDRLVDWGASPERLEFATKLAPIPPH